jgi:hypothetical protein
MRHVRRVRIYVPMDRFAYMHQRGGNQATPVLLASANGFGLARLIGNADELYPHGSSYRSP